MADHLLAALFVLVTWWVSTGAILIMDGLPRSTFRRSVTLASVLAVAGLCGLAWSSRVDSSGAAYLAFGCALAVWAWHELTFMLGLVTGPRKEPCPPGARGWSRFVYATETLIHHEVALALTVLAIVALTWGEPNQVGTWTFLVLWVMRLSAKLNVFLGVRNLTTELIPEHLRYLLSYFRKARLNPLMPVSLIAGSVVAFGLVAEGQVGCTLVATLLALAVIEHLFLALPVPDAILWRWALKPSRLPKGDRG